NNNTVELSRFIEVIEENLGKTAKKDYLPLQPGDVPMTHADVDDLIRDVGFKPATSIETGIAAFLDWYRGYFKV
ncbi:MAG: capsular biosynthesis protein CpsI, partial [Desulfovibrio sp.]|nr:capsular biosynthesis protein CpsI [Desulfovibrio sp.]